MGKKLDKIYNPIAIINESEEKRNLKKEQKGSSKSTPSEDSMHIKHFY